jgi:threonine synthase
MTENIFACYTSDETTRAAIKNTRGSRNYFLDPHGAVGWAAVDRLLNDGKISGTIVVLETAHPAKFAGEVEPLTGPVPVPPSLERALARTASSVTIPADVDALLENLC